MSTTSAAAPAQSAGQTDPLKRLSALFKRYTPSQGWLTLGLLLLSVGTVAESVSSVEWVSTPGLAGVLLLSVVSALVLAKLPLPALLLHPVALLLGMVVVVFQTTTLAEDPNLIGAAREIGDRLIAWYREAEEGGGKRGPDAHLHDNSGADLAPRLHKLVVRLQEQYGVGSCSAQRTDDGLEPELPAGGVRLEVLHFPVLCDASNGTGQRRPQARHLAPGRDGVQSHEVVGRPCTPPCG